MAEQVIGERVTLWAREAPSYSEDTTFGSFDDAERENVPSAFVVSFGSLARAQ